MVPIFFHRDKFYILEFKVRCFPVVLVSDNSTDNRSFLWVGKHLRFTRNVWLTEAQETKPQNLKREV